MTKSEFIDKVADKAAVTRAEAARVVEAIFDTATGAISEAVHAAGSLSIRGFGTFTKRTTAARTARNPRTGSSLRVPERTTVRFAAGKSLQERRRASQRRSAIGKGVRNALVEVNIEHRSRQSGIEGARTWENEVIASALRLGLSEQVIAAAISVEPGTLTRWGTGAAPVSPQQRRKVKELQQLLQLLDEIFVDAKAANQWLHALVPALRDRTPLSYLQAGKIRPVSELLATFHSGAFM